VTLISWILTVISVIGAILNARKSIWGFYIWLPVNVAWIVYNFKIGQPGQAVLFLVYTVISTWGIIQWRKRK